MQIQEPCNYILAQNFITGGNVILFLHIVGNYSYNENIEIISLVGTIVKEWTTQTTCAGSAAVLSQDVCLPGLWAWVNPAQQNRLWGKPLILLLILLPIHALGLSIPAHFSPQQQPKGTATADFCLCEKLLRCECELSPWQEGSWTLLFFPRFPPVHMRMSTNIYTHAPGPEEWLEELVSLLLIVLHRELRM